MARFDFNDLLKKEKEELDKIKTALDIYQSEDKYAFERKKFRTENLRFFAIAIMTAVISLGSSYFIESFKQKNTNREDVKREFTDLKKSYLTADKEKQNDIACALAGFDNSIADNSIETARKNFVKICNSSVEIQTQTLAISNTDTTSTEVKTALNQLDHFDKQLQDLKQQTRIASAFEKNKIIQEIAIVNKKVDQVVNETPAIRSAVKSTETIEQNVKNIDAVDYSIKQQVAGGTGQKSEVTWFKEGYFLQFGDYRVLLLYLDKQLGIQVEVCKTKSTDACPNPILTKVWIRFDKPLEFSDNGNHCRINLEAIDHAGKNPFKLAAYVTFENLNRKE